MLRSRRINRALHYKFDNMDIRLTRYIILLALLPLLLLSMTGCGGNGAARRSLDRADSLMNSKPEVAMAILDSVNAESLHGKKRKGALCVAEINRA